MDIKTPVPTDKIQLDGGAKLIAREYLRQIDEEGLDADNKEFSFQELVRAGVSYGIWAIRFVPTKFLLQILWPWWTRDGVKRRWKPEDTKRNLIKAGAMIAAAIDRLEDDREITP